MRRVMVDAEDCIDIAHDVGKPPTSWNDDNAMRAGGLGDCSQHAIEMLAVFKQASADFDDERLLVVRMVIVGSGFSRIAHEQRHRCRRRIACHVNTEIIGKRDDVEAGSPGRIPRDELAQTSHHGCLHRWMP